MSNTITPRRNTRRIITGSAIGAAALAAAVLPASGALAAGGPVSASVVVPSTLTFTFTSGTSFSLTPGVTDVGAVSWSILSNDPVGETVSQSAPDLAGPGGVTLPAGDLSAVYHMTLPKGSGPGPSEQLTNSVAVIADTTGNGPSLPGGDLFSQDWLATIPASTPAGTFSTTITYIATGD